MDFAPTFIQKMDWELFKKQRIDLVKTIEDLKVEAKAAGEAGDEERATRYEQQAESIDGILNMLGEMCDYAVDVCKLDENKVMLTELDEPEPILEDDYKEMSIHIKIKTGKDRETIVKALEKGIYRGLDSPPFYIAAPSEVKINIK